MISQFGSVDGVGMNGCNEGLPVQGNVPSVSLPSGLSHLVPSLQAAMLKRGFEYLYLIACDEVGLYKIGFSEDPIRRFNELQFISAYELRLHATFMVPKGCGEVFENLLHRALAHCRTHGEWFKLAPDELAFFNQQYPFAIFMDRAELDKTSCKPPLLKP